MKAIAFDTETKGFSWWTPEEQAFLATWADENGEYSADLSDGAQVGRFRKAIEGADIVIGHNIKFDAHQVRHTLGFDPIAGKEIHDTDTMARLLYPEGAGGKGFGFGLKSLATIHLSADSKDPEDAIKEMAKQIGLRSIKKTGAYYEVYRAFPDVMTRYALADARYTYDLWDKFRTKFDSSMRSLYTLEMNVIRSLDQAEEYGVKTDQVQTLLLKAQYTAARDELFTTLETVLGEQALGGEGSTQAMIDALLSIGIPLTELTESGQLATNKRALQPFEKDFPIIGDLFEFRRMERFLSTYIGAVEGRDIVHTSFQPIGAWTGRMACRSPNMQNFPKRAGKEVRSVLVPRDGHAFVVSDFESIEVRLLAYYLGNSEFKRMVVERDSHAWMASNIWGGRPEDYAKGGPGEAKRNIAKNVLFAITYGAGGPRVRAMLLDAGLEATIDEAKRIISIIKSNLPGYYKLMRKIRKKIEDLGYVNTILRRKQPVDKRKSYVGLNALIQGSAADIMKLAWIAIGDALSAAGIWFERVLVVHDEAVVECLIEDAFQVREIVKVAMETCITIQPALSVSASIVTTSYADA